jgi:hypothetical protein
MSFEDYTKNLKLNNSMMGVHFERFMFGLADKMVVGYNGGNWESMKLGRTRIVLLPGNKAEQVTLVNLMSGTTITTDHLTASAIFTCMLNNWFWNQYAGKLTDAQNQRFMTAHNMLREAVYGKNSGINTTDYFNFTD